MPISGYCQKVYEIVINRDTVTVMPKYHAKQLARERIMYRAAKEQLKEKDCLIYDLNTHIKTFKNIIAEQKKNISDYITKDSISVEIVKSYQREIESEQKKGGFKKVLPYIATVLAFILGTAI